MVAEGLGLTVLPDYSVIGDPLERTGLITARRIAGDRTGIRLTVVQRRQNRTPDAVRRLVAALVAQATLQGEAAPAAV